MKTQKLEIIIQKVTAYESDGTAGHSFVCALPKETGLPETFQFADHGNLKNLASQVDKVPAVYELDFNYIVKKIQDKPRLHLEVESIKYKRELKFTLG